MCGILVVTQFRSPGDLCGIYVCNLSRATESVQGSTYKQNNSIYCVSSQINHHMIWLGWQQQYEHISWILLSWSVMLCKVQLYETLMANCVDDQTNGVLLYSVADYCCIIIRSHSWGLWYLLPLAFQPLQAVDAVVYVFYNLLVPREQKSAKDIVHRHQPWRMQLWEEQYLSFLFLYIHSLLHLKGKPKHKLNWSTGDSQMAFHFKLSVTIN